MFGVNISKNILLDGNLTACQKQFIFDGNVSKKKYLTFDERRVKYLHTIIQQIDAQEPMSNCKIYQSQESRKKPVKQLRGTLMESCGHLRPKDFYIAEKREKIYDELMSVCR